MVEISATMRLHPQESCSTIISQYITGFKPRLFMLVNGYSGCASMYYKCRLHSNGHSKSLSLAEENPSSLSHLRRCHFIIRQ